MLSLLLILEELSEWDESFGVSGGGAIQGQALGDYRFCAFIKHQLGLLESLTGIFNHFTWWKKVLCSLVCPWIRLILQANLIWMLQKWQKLGNCVRRENISVNYLVAVFPGSFEMLVPSSFRVSIKIIVITSWLEELMPLLLFLLPYLITIPLRSGTGADWHQTKNPIHEGKP